jgi:peptide/nickel transport system substrate-binding protein
MQRLLATLVVIFAIGGSVTPVGAKTLRWASQGDYQTADPYSQNELLTNLFAQQVHDTLMRDKDMKIVPAWGVDAGHLTTWRFNRARA